MSNEMKDRTCLVTGANTGIGRVTAQALAGMGATVILACRSPEKGEAARAEIAKQTGNPHLSVVPLDVSSLASVRQAAETVRTAHPKLDVLVNNAGAWWQERQVSVDGIELQWATNVVGPFALTQLLLPSLLQSGHGRIINVASTAASGLKLDEVGWDRGKYSGVSVYSACKQANRMLTWAQARRLKGRPVTANAMSPGLVNTQLNRSTAGFFKVVFTITKLFGRTPEQGADTVIYLASSPELEGVSDKFYADRKSIPCKFRNEAEEEKLFALCARQAGL